MSLDMDEKHAINHVELVKVDTSHFDAADEKANAEQINLNSNVSAK